MVNHRNYFGIILENKIPNGIGVEVGVQRGLYSEILLEHWKTGTLHSIDRWLYTENYKDIANKEQNVQDSYHQETKKRLERFENRSKVIKKDSVEAAKDYADGSLDFVYIDADHSYEGCLRDIQLWYPKIRTGGIISGHDYLNGNLRAGVFGVKRAVDEFFNERINDLNIIPDPGGWKTWWLIK